MNESRKVEPNTLTRHERKVLELVKRHPEVLDSRSAREKVAGQSGMTEKTFRNRLADLKRYGLIGPDGARTTRGKSDESLMTNLEHLWKKRRFIFINTVVFATISVVVSLLLPKWFKSEAVIISSGVGEAPSFLSMLTGIPLGNIGLSPLSEDISNYIAILESRTVKEHMVKEFDLVNRYGSRDVEYAMKAFSSNVDLRVTEEGTLEIGALDNDPETAYLMVWELLKELDKSNRRLSSEKGKYNRQFLEERLVQNRRDLAEAEERLREFQQRTGVIDIQTQAKALMEAYGLFYTEKLQAYAMLYAQQAETEIQLNVARATMGKDSPSVHKLELLLEEQKIQLDISSSDMDNQFVQILERENVSGDRKSTDPGRQVFPPFKDIPPLAMESVRLIREVEVQNKILELLLPQYEQARMEEMKNVPSIQILDEPQIAINKTKPKRAIIVIATTLMAFMFSTLFVYSEHHTREIRARLRNI